MQSRPLRPVFFLCAVFLASSAMLQSLLPLRSAQAATTVMSGIVPGGTISPGDEWDVLAGTWMMNTGSLTNGGTLANADLLDNVFGGVLINNDMLTNTGTLRNDGTLSNAVSGTLTNDRLLQNSGTMTNDGLVMNAGTLTNTGTFFSPGHLTNNGMLVNTGTLTNALYNQITNTNAGMLLNYGTLTNEGTLTNDGTLYTLAGGTLLNTGTLANTFGLFNEGTLTNSGTLTNAGTASMPGLVANSGTLTNTGILTNGLYGQLTNESGASLVNTGTLTNDYLLYNAGTLTNTGTLTNDGDLGVENGGTLLNYGTINGGGNFLVFSGSTLGLAMGSALAQGRLYLSSSALYRGLGSSSGTASLSASGGVFDPDTHTATSFSTTYKTLLTTSVFTATGAGATLTYTTNPLSAAGGNGGGLDGALANAAAGTTLKSIFDTLYNSSSDKQIRHGVQQLAGEGVINTPMLVNGQVAAFRTAMCQRQSRFSSGGSGLVANGLASNGQAADAGGLWSTMGNNGGPNGSYGDNGLAATLAQMMVMNADENAGLTGASLTARGQVQQIHQGANGGYGGYNGELGLAALGYDTPVTDNLRLGAGFGYSGGQLRGGDVTTNLHTWFGSLYGTLALPQEIRLDADLTYAYTSAKVHGDYVWPVADYTTGNYAANTYSGSVKVSRGFLFFGDNGPRVTPSVALEAALSDRDAFTESGGTISKRFGASTMNTVDIPVGAALSQDYDYGKGTATPEFSAYYVRRLADTRATGDMTLLGSTSTASVSGASTGRNLVRANLGGRITTQDNVDFSLFYNGEFGDHYANNGMTMEVKYNF